MNLARPSKHQGELRKHVRCNLNDWARNVLERQGLRPARHHLHILTALDALTKGETSRLMVLMPPGSAKSTYASLLFPAWWIARHPTKSVITACHTASLAEHFGRGVRALLADNSCALSVKLRPDSRAAGRFITDNGGEYFAIGVNGAVTGRRADLALIDDPIRGYMDAENSMARERLWNWYRSEFATRLKPNAKTVLTMTRWHSDDLAGRLLERGDWTVLRLPALAEALDPLQRRPGEALWPEWEDFDAIEAKRSLLGERLFAATFQQSPIAESGKLFDLSKLRLLDSVPPGTAVRGWDFAALGQSSNNGDWTVGVRLLRDEDGGYIVDDVRRIRVAPAELNALIKDTAQCDGTSVIIAIPRDPGQAGIYQATSITKALAGFRVISGPETGSKTFRATFVASQIANGNLHLRRGAWNGIFIEELSTFPDSHNDDQVDALARAFNTLASAPQPARYSALSYINR